MKKNSKVRVAAILLFVFLLASTGLKAQTSEKISAEFGNYFEQVKKLNPQVKDFHKMEIGEVYALPNDQTDHLEITDLNGIWGRELDKYNKLRLDPVTSGPQVVEGGIKPGETERLQSFFENEAKLKRAELIGSIEHGTISGEGFIGYRDGEMKPHLIQNPIPAYRATFKMPDGTTETYETLQGCMNPAKTGIGKVYKGFTFLPDGKFTDIKNVKDDNEKSRGGWGDSFMLTLYASAILSFLALIGFVAFATIYGRTSSLQEQLGDKLLVETPKAKKTETENNFLDRR